MIEDENWLIFPEKIPKYFICLVKINKFEIPWSFRRFKTLNWKQFLVW